MTLHFIHVGKTGGTAIKRALRSVGLAYRRDEDPRSVQETPYGAIKIHDHTFHARHVPPGDHFFFCLRDPISRFISGYQSRLSKGRPRYYFEWTDQERAIFETFPRAQDLAMALSSDGDRGELARWAMQHVRHLEPMRRYTGTPRELRARRAQVVYIARQETLDDDWHQLKVLLGLPVELMLPTDPVRAHRSDPSSKPVLGADAERALRNWYAHDYGLLRYCDRVRAWRGWGIGPEPSSVVRRAGRRAARARGVAAVLPPPPPAVRRRLPHL